LPEIPAALHVLIVPRLSIEVDPAREIGAIDRKIFGHFIEHLGRCIYGGVFEPGSPLADERGFRADVLEAMRRLGVPNLRWPGGNFASSYYWEDGIGPVAQRPARFDLAWRTLEPNTFGTDEFMAYCRELGAEPYVCVNSSSGTLQEAAHWVEYCNLDVQKYPSYHARRRAENGHAAPYGVKYWGIGNEVYGAWQVGFSGAEEYARKCREYAHFMRAVDPHVKLVAVGADIPEWDEAVLRYAGDTINYISNHQYHGQEDYHATVGAVRYVEEHLHRLGEMIDDWMPRLVGGRVHLDDVGVAALHDLGAVAAEHGHLDRGPVRAIVLVIESAREDAGGGRLADAAHTRQHEPLRDAPGGEGVSQRLHHRALADEVVERLRPVLAGEHEIRLGRCGEAGRRGLGRR
jgi:hypothetical protein